MRTFHAMEHMQGSRGPDCVQLLLDGLSLAEDDLTLNELLGGLVVLIAETLDSGPTWALLARRLAEHPHELRVGREMPFLASLRGELDRADCGIVHAVVLTHGCLTDLASQDVGPALDCLDDERCVVAWDAAGEQIVAIVVELPDSAAGDAARLQATLQHVLTAVLQRHRSALMQRRRMERAATLATILADIASDLDIDVLLANIVEQARQLIGTDSAYLAEVDGESGTVTMRVTVGISDDGYKRGSVQIGKGMAGAVAAAKHAMWTRDYLMDERFEHTRDTDGNVTREGIRSVIMAPLQVRDRVTGVLGVANHHAADFADDDVRMAQSLADGAAVALENARLYSAQTRLVEQQRSLNELTSLQNDLLRRSMRIHEQLAEIVLQGHGIEVIANRLADLFANPVIVLSQFCGVLAASGIDVIDAARMSTTLQRGLLEAGAAPERREAAAWRRPTRLGPRESFGIAADIVLTAVMAGHDLLGYVVVIESQQRLDDLDFQALEQSLTVVALEFTRSRVAFEVENRLRGDLVHDLVLGAFDPATIVGRAARLGHDLTLPQVIAAVSLDPFPADGGLSQEHHQAEVAQRLERALQTHFRRRSVMAQTSIMGDVIVTLLASRAQRNARKDDAMQVLARVRSEAACDLAPRTISVGVSRAAHNHLSLSHAYQEAMQSLRTAQQRGLGGEIVEFERLGIDRFLLQLPNPGEIDSYVEFMLGPLLAYDAEHGQRLVPTLSAFVDSGGHQRATADALGIHVNTLQYRLRRIEEIAQLRLGDPETRLDLQLALRARRMRLAMPPARFQAHGGYST